MPPPNPSIEVFHVTPDQAQAYAVPMQGFLKDALTGLYIHELGLRMNVLADPTDLSPGGKVELQAERIAASGDLSAVGSAAYVLAVDAERREHGGIIGLAKLVRKGRARVEIEEVDVALDRRRERIGSALLDQSLGTLAVGPRDLLVLDVLVGNRQARSFWEASGFRYTGRRHHHDYIFPNPKDYHLEMQAPESAVHLFARDRIRAS